MPETLIRVVLSVTSIPSRTNVTLPTTLLSLQQQTYPGIVGIVLTVPRVNARGIPGTADMSFLTDVHQTPWPLTVHTPAHDFGPVMKYVGVDEALPPTPTDDHLYVIVVDDDQKYRPNRVQDLVDQMLQVRPRERANTCIASPTKNGLAWLHGSFFWPLGFLGVLVPVRAVRFIAETVRAKWPLPKYALLNDDVIAGSVMYSKGIQFRRDTSPQHYVGVDGNENSLTIESGKEKGLDMLKCRRLMASPSAVVAGEVTLLAIPLLVALLCVVIGMVLMARM
jgi:hypothetical protein